MSQHDLNERKIDQLLIFWLEQNLQAYEMGPLTIVIDLLGAKTIVRLFSWAHKIIKTISGFYICQIHDTLF